MAREVRQRRRPAPPPEADRSNGPDAAGPSGDYAVGYGKPPRHTQFKPGQSGNPKGRPAGSKSLKTLIERELDTKVTVREGGRSLRLTKRQVLAKRLVNKAIEGDARSQQTLLKLDQNLAASQRSANDNAPPPDAPPDKDDQEIFDLLVAMIKDSVAQEIGTGAPDRKGATEGPVADVGDEEGT